MSWFFEKAEKVVDVTDEWDFYFLRVDDKPASISVDLGRMKAIPQKGYEAFAYVSLAMKQARADGLSSQEEFSTLGKIEEHLLRKANKANIIYVGRNTTDGKRDFYFYVCDLAKALKVLTSAMLAFPEYQYEADGREDADWSVYRTFLYPSPMDMQRILNRRVLENLKKHGDDLSLPRNIDHRVYFKNAHQVAAFGLKVQSMGYEIAQTGVKTTESEAYIDFSKSGAPQDIDDLVYEIIEAVNEYEGDYDGWGCSVVKE